MVDWENERYRDRCSLSSRQRDDRAATGDHVRDQFSTTPTTPQVM
jgi:hypothetical protein